jgi:hypothetical protein
MWPLLGFGLIPNAGLGRILAGFIVLIIFFWICVAIAGIATLGLFLPHGFTFLPNILYYVGLGMLVFGVRRQFKAGRHRRSFLTGGVALLIIGYALASSALLDKTRHYFMLPTNTFNQTALAFFKSPPPVSAPDSDVWTIDENLAYYVPASRLNELIDSRESLTGALDTFGFEGYALVRLIGIGGFYQGVLDYQRTCHDVALPLTSSSYPYAYLAGVGENRANMGGEPRSYEMRGLYGAIFFRDWPERKLAKYNDDRRAIFYPPMTKDIIKDCGDPAKAAQHFGIDLPQMLQQEYNEIRTAYNKATLDPLVNSCRAFRDCPYFSFSLNVHPDGTRFDQNAKCKDMSCRSIDIPVTPSIDAIIPTQLQLPQQPQYYSLAQALWIRRTEDFKTKDNFDEDTCRLSNFCRSFSNHGYLQDKAPDLFSPDVR